MALFQISFYAPSLRRTVPIQVVLPTDRFLPGEAAREDAPYPTLYLLHGVFGSCGDWVNGTRVAAQAQEAGLCVVMPSGDNKFYCDSPITGDYYGRFISEDLVDFVERTFPVSRRREDRFIAGLSMGGYGAVVNGLRHPERFSRIAGFSSGLIKERVLRSVNGPGCELFTREQYQAMFGLKDAADFEGSPCDYDALARSVAASSSPRPAVYLCCGTEDALMPANRAYRALLEKLNFDVLWEEWPGGHDWTFWDEAIRRTIVWLGKK